MRSGSHVVLVTFCALGCAPDGEPCLTWAKPGATYLVTLGAPDAVPESASALEARTCGAEFDLEPGDSFELKTSGAESNSPSCELLQATTSSAIRNVSLGAAGGHLGGAPTPHMEASFPNATVGEDCRGRYDLGLNLSDKLRAYRTFETLDASTCRVEGSELTEAEPWCWDSWLVEVRDSTGQVVALSE